MTEPQALPLLPTGALIGGERYRVVKVVHQSKQLNRYVIEGSERVIVCPSCNTDNPDDSYYCQECATSLVGIQPITVRYRLKEAASAERFQTEYTLAAQGLAHSNVIPPRDAFDQKVNESSRSYVVLDDLTWKTSAEAGTSQELPVVLAWGIGLADGLTYLHMQRIVMGILSGSEVALIQRVARWADFEKARLVPVEEWQQNGTQLIAADVRSLAQLLYYLIAGLNQFDPGNRLLTPKANALFAKALGSIGFLTAEDLATALRDVETDVRRPVGIDVHAARLSDVGKERDLDEDSILTLELGQVYRSLSTPLGVYAIADGMGGHDSGDVASSLAIKTIARHVVSDLLSAALDNDPPTVDYEAWIKKVVQDANQAVLARRKAAGNNMGTTLVMAVVVNNIAYLAHVGDSRAYLIRNAQIHPLTVDHSLVERLIATKQITREEAATHPQRNVIYKNIGDRAQVEPDISRQQLEPGDRLLLCCDGLSGEVSDADLLRIMLENPALPEACWQLIQAANDAGGHDNISVVLIQVVATR